MSVTRGKDFKLYRNTDDPYDNSPSWSLVTNVRDLTRNVEKALADASTRAASVRQQVSTMIDVSIDFQMVYDGGADVTAFEDAFWESTDIELAFLDALISVSGAKGLRGMFQVSKFTVNEALEDVGLVDVTVVPAYYPTNVARRVSSNGSIHVDA